MENIVLTPLTETHLAGWWDSEKSTWKENWYPPNYFENRNHLLAKLKSFPWGCWVAGGQNEKMGDCIGYAFSHPWSNYSPPPKLNQFDFRLPKDLDCYYVHDICVAPDFRRQGVGIALTIKVLAIAAALGYSKVKLISVLNSHTYWQKFGFECIQECEYGGKPAKVMVKNEL